VLNNELLRGGQAVHGAKLTPTTNWADYNQTNVTDPRRGCNHIITMPGMKIRSTRHRPKRMGSDPLRTKVGGSPRELRSVVRETPQQRERHTGQFNPCRYPPHLYITREYYIRVHRESEQYKDIRQRTSELNHKPSRQSTIIKRAEWYERSYGSLVSHRRVKHPI